MMTLVFMAHVRKVVSGLTSSRQVQVQAGAGLRAPRAWEEAGSLLQQQQ